MKRSKDWIDTYKWVISVIDSAQTFNQIISSVRLIDLWYKQNQDKALAGHFYEQLLLIKATKLDELQQ